MSLYHICLRNVIRRIAMIRANDRVANIAKRKKLVKK